MSRKTRREVNPQQEAYAVAYYRQANKRISTASKQYRNTGRTRPCWGEGETREKEAEMEQEQKKSPGLFHIDHIIPLKGSAGSVHVVCGLHVADNLRLITKRANLRKSFIVWPDMWFYSKAHARELYTMWLNVLSDEEQEG